MRYLMLQATCRFLLQCGPLRTLRFSDSRRITMAATETRLRTPHIRNGCENLRPFPKSYTFTGFSKWFLWRLIACSSIRIFAFETQFEFSTTCETWAYRMCMPLRC